MVAAGRCAARGDDGLAARAIDVPVYGSASDSSPEAHVRVGELALERARRLAEQGEDVVLLLDSITRLARARSLVQGRSRRARRMTTRRRGEPRSPRREALVLGGTQHRRAGLADDRWRSRESTRTRSSSSSSTRCSRTARTWSFASTPSWRAPVSSRRSTSTAAGATCESGRARRRRSRLARRAAPVAALAAPAEAWQRVGRAAASTSSNSELIRPAASALR